MAGNLMGNNFFSEGKSTYKVLLEQANKSFQKEKILYDLINQSAFNGNNSAVESFSKNVGSISELNFSNYLDYYNFFINRFSEFQEAIKIAIYGEGYQFIELLYDKTFLSEIAVFDKSLDRKIDFITSSSKGEQLSENDPRNNYVDFQNAIKEVEVTSKEQMKKSAQIKKAAQALINMINNSSIFEQQIDIDDNIDKITETIIESGQFTFGFSGGKKMSSIELIDYLDNVYKGKTTKTGSVAKKATLMSGELEAKFLEDGKYPLFSIDTFVNMKKGQDGLRIFLFGSKKVLKPILNDTISLLQRENFTLRENGDNGFLVTLNSLDGVGEYSVNNLESLQRIASYGAKAFLDKIFSSLSIRSSEAAKSFDIWRKKNNVESILTEMIKEDPHILQVLLKNKDLAQVVGTLGEVMTSLLFQILAKTDNKLQKVAILGQTNFGMGDAAIDVRILTKELGSIGLQIKTYSSINSTIDLYAQSSLLNRNKSKYIQRYIEEEGLKILEEMFFSFYNKEKHPLSLIGRDNKDEETPILEKAKNIFEQSIPYFLRFDEAQLEKQQTDLTQNNFFIINFNFVPTSLIFLTIVKSLEAEEKQNYEDLFHFSAEKKSGDRLPAENFNSSWYKTKDIIKKDSNYSNLVEGNLNTLYINFVGAKIKFKNELNIVIASTLK